MEQSVTTGHVDITISTGIGVINATSPTINSADANPGTNTINTRSKQTYRYHFNRRHHQHENHHQDCTWTASMIKV
jgi:hypothetical protein